MGRYLNAKKNKWTKMTNIILCGGSGTRLWPISRKLLPKQFIKLFNERSLFQLTMLRNKTFSDKNLIVSNEEQYFLAQDELEGIGLGGAKFLLEPIGKNTAPAIALACLACDEQEIVLVSSSDHLIKNEQNYTAMVNEAKKLAKDDFLVVFGISPGYAEVGYGYIQASGNDVLSFKEKPSLDLAQEYVKSGDYYWNSGIFCFKAGVFLRELKTHDYEIYEACLDAFNNASKEPIRIKTDYMEKIKSLSVDYAVMEKSKKTKVVLADIDWSDMGSFDALYDALPKDENNNTISPNFLNVGCKNNLVIAQNKQIAAIDIEDMILVDTDDALLVCKKGSSQKVKQIVGALQKSSSELCNIHTTGYRPWGSYTVLGEGEGYKMKRIEVKPQKRLSLQKHRHRNEHWVVVSGEAKVEIDGNEFILEQNQSTYIKAGQTHRLSNDTNSLVVIVEVQVGSYTGEDDIIRIEDDYARS